MSDYCTNTLLKQEGCVSYTQVSVSTSKIEITLNEYMKINQTRSGGTCTSFTSPGGGTKTMSLCHKDEAIRLLIIRDLPL